MEVDLWNEIKRQLEASGLFKVNLDSTEWDQYKDEAFEGHVQHYGMGWFPDFPDADNYLRRSCAMAVSSSTATPTRRSTRRSTSELATDDAAKREEAFGDVQDAEALTFRWIPLWEGKQVAAVREGVEGVEKTFDPAFLFRFWLITKKESANRMSRAGSLPGLCPRHGSR